MLQGFQEGKCRKKALPVLTNVSWAKISAKVMYNWNQAGLW
jgi:hypothetical protein